MDYLYDRDASRSDSYTSHVSRRSPVLQMNMADLWPEMLILFHGVLPGKLEVTGIEYQSEFFGYGKERIDQFGIVA